MWKAAGIALVIVTAVLVGYLVHVAQSGGITVASTTPPVQLSYSDMVSVTLTVFGVILAVASIALGVAGIVGWNSIESKAMRVAEEVTRSNLNDESSSLHKILKQAVANPNSPLHQTLKAEAQRAMYEGVQAVGDDTDEPLLPDDNSVPTAQG